MPKAYMIGDQYLEIHESSDGDIDYTIFSNTLEEEDGGRVECGEEAFVLKMIAFMHDLTGPLRRLDYEDFCDRAYA